MNEFETLVQKCRHAQKEYFRTRASEWLHESKRLEKLVDKYLFEKQNPSLGI